MFSSVARADDQVNLSFLPLFFLIVHSMGRPVVRAQSGPGILPVNIAPAVNTAGKQLGAGDFIQQPQKIIDAFHAENRACNLRTHVASCLFYVIL